MQYKQVASLLWELKRTWECVPSRTSIRQVISYNKLNLGCFFPVSALNKYAIIKSILRSSPFRRTHSFLDMKFNTTYVHAGKQ